MEFLALLAIFIMGFGFGLRVLIDMIRIDRKDQRIDELLSKLIALDKKDAPQDCIIIEAVEIHDTKGD